MKCHTEAVGCAATPLRTVEGIMGNVIELLGIRVSLAPQAIQASGAFEE